MTDTTTPIDIVPRLKMRRMQSIYLAVPYSSPMEDVRRARFEEANKVAGILMQRGFAVFSPISHSHPISLHLGNSLSHDFWLAQDRYWMNRSDVLVVLKLPGWKQSKGVAYEIWYFRVSGKPVEYME